MKDNLLPEPLTDEREEDQDNDRSRRMDSELRIMGNILRLLDDLDSDAAKGRVVSYIWARFTGEAKK